MPIIDLLRSQLSSSSSGQSLLRRLEWFDMKGDDTYLRNFLETHKSRDYLFSESFNPNDDKYSYIFVRLVERDIIEAYRRAIVEGDVPEIDVSLDEARALAASLNLSFGSPADFLYAFTSERYERWMGLLHAFHLKSACMSGQGRCTVTIAPRFLDISSVPADKEVDELAGAISNDFTEAYAALFDKPSFKDGILESLTYAQREDLDLDGHIDIDVINLILSYLRENMSSEDFTLLKKDRMSPFLSEVERISAMQSRSAIRSFKGKLNQDTSVSLTQEQIALKFLEEGKFLQKLLLGKRVEDVQSNVKQVKNIRRSNKVEVDRIYKVAGEKEILLVEAKAGTKISRAQLYQLYETFSLKLPPGWQVKVVAVLINSRASHPMNSVLPEDVRLVLDLAEIEFDETVFGKITESLKNIRLKKHYRWLIK